MSKNGRHIGSRVFPLFLRRKLAVAHLARGDIDHALGPNLRFTTMPADSIVKARIDTETKERAAAALGAMGLSISDAIRLLMLRVAKEQRLQFDVQVPNVASRQALKD
jgi:DNA-damage-inducible protein J